LQIFKERLTGEYFDR